MRRRNLGSSLTARKIAWHIKPIRSLRNRPMPSAYFLFLLLLLLFCFCILVISIRLFFFTANACCYFGNRDVDQTEQGSGRCNKHFPIRAIFVISACTSYEICLHTLFKQQDKPESQPFSVFNKTWFPTGASLCTLFTNDFWD